MTDLTPWKNRIVGHGEEAPDQLLANPRNHRIHPKAQQEALSGVLDEIGMIRSVLVNRRTGTVVDGHLRIELAISRNEPTVPVEYVDLSEEEEALALTVLDEIAGMAGRDSAILKETLAFVKPQDARVKALLEHIARGARLLNAAKTSEAAERQAAASAALMEKWHVEPGQCWVIPSNSIDGEHRLVIGDATNADDVKRALGGHVPNICVTDPPYGVEYDPKLRASINLSGEMYMEGVSNDDRADWSAAFELFPGNVLYHWFASMNETQVEAAVKKADFEPRCIIIWGKKQPIISMGHYHWQHEPLMYAVRKGKDANWRGDRTQTTLWTDIDGMNVVERPDGDDQRVAHATQKPVECMRRPMMNHTIPGDYVYDPFMGSGTTFAAAELCSRLAIGLEIDPKFAAVILDRLEGMGLAPRLETVTKGKRK